MMHIETFREGRKNFVKLPELEFNKLLEELEDLRDVHAVRMAKKAIASGALETFPAAFVRALMEAKHSGEKIAIWRKYRKIKRNQLAEKIGVTGSYISMLEAGKRGGDAKLFKKIADALSCDVEAII
jgi:DNA-binding XRE family transcriptional regulator